MDRHGEKFRVGRSRVPQRSRAQTSATEPFGLILAVPHSGYELAEAIVGLLRARGPHRPERDEPEHFPIVGVRSLVAGGLCHQLDEAAGRPIDVGPEVLHGVSQAVQERIDEGLGGSDLACPEPVPGG